MKNRPMRVGGVGCGKEGRAGVRGGACSWCTVGEESGKRDGLDALGFELGLESCAREGVETLLALRREHKEADGKADGMHTACAALPCCLPVCTVHTRLPCLHRLP